MYNNCEVIFEIEKHTRTGFFSPNVELESEISVGLHTNNIYISVGNPQRVVSGRDRRPGAAARRQRTRVFRLNDDNPSQLLR